jgi:hypothetical protein
LLTPPHAHATTSAEFENATNSFDDASTVLDESGSLGSFLDATVAWTKQMGNTTATPVSSPESRECPSDDLDEAYIELNYDFIDEFHATSEAGAIRDLLARRTVRYKLSPDAKFATSSIILVIRIMISLLIYLTYLLLRTNLFVVLKMKVLWGT